METTDAKAVSPYIAAPGVVSPLRHDGRSRRPPRASGVECDNLSMGFDTTLSLTGIALLLWRKDVSALPRLLFRHDQLCVEVTPDSPTEDEVSISVQYCTTAGDALDTLESAGLGWDATVAAYGVTMFEAASRGLLMSAGMSDTTADAEYEAKVIEFQNRDPANDLMDMGKFLAHQVFVTNDDSSLFGQLSYDGSIDSWFSTVYDVYKYASQNMLDVNVFCLVRAVESWCALHREAPLVAWPMLLSIILHAVDANSPVIYDITDAAWEYENVETVEQGLQYGADYWQSSSESLSSAARVTGQLFSVLGSFDSKLGREFWFARGSALLSKLVALNENKRTSTTKARGDALEALVNAIVQTESPELEVVERNFRTREEEIDLLVTNGLKDPFWLAHNSPLLLIECKNTKDKTGVPDLRVFESKIIDRGALCRVGIFVSMAGFTETFYDRLKSFQAGNGVIFAVTGDDLTYIISEKIRMSEWLRAEGLTRSLANEYDPQHLITEPRRFCVVVRLLSPATIGRISQRPSSGLRCHAYYST